MDKTKKCKGNEDKNSRPLALHVRRLRQWYEKRSLTQEELANLSGIHCRRVRKLESARELPEPVEQLLALALALRVPLEVLIAPNLIEDLNSQIAKRRHELGLELTDTDDTVPDNQNVW